MNTLLKTASAILLFVFLYGCEDNTREINQNNLIPASRVDFTLNSTNLENALGFEIIENRGVKGVVVYKSANGSLKAFDLACPFLSQTECKEAMDTSNLPASLNCSNCIENTTAFSLENPVQKIGDVNYELQQYRVQKIDQFQYRVSNF